MREDWKVNDSAISKVVVSVYRIGNYIHYKVKPALIRKLLMVIYKILDLIFVKIVAGADIPHTCRIGIGVYLPHGAKGVVIHPNAVVGSNTKIYHQVTIGSDGLGNNSAPTIGDNVVIGAGAKVLGKINVGNGSKIGANAVLLKSIPSGSTAVGVPAIVVNKNKAASL